MSKIPFNPSNEEVETILHKEQFKKDEKIKIEINNMMGSDEEFNEEKYENIVDKISTTNKNDLVRYVAYRRYILDIFKKSLTSNSAGVYPEEKIVHKILYPLGQDSETTSYADHNLWIIDERLNFTEYIASEKTLPGSDDRGDLIAYDNRVMFRGDNVATNPVTIIEFKRPGRDDFTNPSAKDDPVDQVVRYTNIIRCGKVKVKSHPIKIGENTPFYGYIFCDLNDKVEGWLEYEKNFNPMPDGQGWFQWREKINLYIAVLNWDKVLDDAIMRNKIFFKKLNII